MARIECPRCGGVVASPRGPAKLRLAKSPVVSLLLRPDGTQALSLVCPHCRQDAEIALPIPARYFRRVEDLRRQVRGR